MSRIGQRDILVPNGVVVVTNDQCVSVSGGNGALTWELPSREISVVFDGATLRVLRSNDSRSSKALHGLSRALIANMIVGVTSGFERKLELHGVGYQASVKLRQLNLNVGFSHTITLNIPDAIVCVAVDPTHLVIRGACKRAVGQFAADVRTVRPPEPYKGKGIRYSNEQVKRKSGKAFGSK